MLLITTKAYPSSFLGLLNPFIQLLRSLLAVVCLTGLTAAKLPAPGFKQQISTVAMALPLAGLATKVAAAGRGDALHLSTD